MKEIYSLSQSFPKSEQFGITSQIRRSSTGILANIAEGFSRSGSADKAYKYTIARGENSETCAFLHIVIELEYITVDHATKAFELSSHVGRLLSGLIQTYSKLPNPNPSPNPS